MASSKKRNKAYRPKALITNPLSFVFSGMQRIEGEHLTDLQVKNHSAMYEMVQGRGTRDGWDKLVGMINMSIVICELGTGAEYHAELLAGRDALYSVCVRYRSIGKFIFTGDEMNAMNTALQIHDAQLEISRVIDIERATDEVIRRIRTGVNLKRVCA